MKLAEDLYLLTDAGKDLGSGTHTHTDTHNKRGSVGVGGRKETSADSSFVVGPDPETQQPGVRSPLISNAL